MIFRNMKQHIRQKIWVCGIGLLMTICFGSKTAVAQEESFHPLGAPKPVTSEFGWRKNPFSGRGSEFHRGIDIDCFEGDSVFAWRGGAVIFTGYNKLSGNMINIAHADNFLSKYHHLKKILVKKGQLVSPGELIGIAGKSGRATGSHLHFSILQNNQHLDPLPYIKKARRVSAPQPVQPIKVPINKRLAIRSFPMDGEVYIDGEHRGRTPIDVQLTYGEHFVEVDTGGKYVRFIGRLWIDQNSGHLYVADLTQTPNQ